MDAEEPGEEEKEDLVAKVELSCEPKKESSHGGDFSTLQSSIHSFWTFLLLLRLLVLSSSKLVSGLISFSTGTSDPSDPRGSGSNDLFLPPLIEYHRRGVIYPVCHHMQSYLQQVLPQTRMRSAPFICEQGPRVRFASQSRKGSL